MRRRPQSQPNLSFPRALYPPTGADLVEQILEIERLPVARDLSTNGEEAGEHDEQEEVHDEEEKDDEQQEEDGAADRMCRRQVCHV